MPKRLLILGFVIGLFYLAFGSYKVPVKAIFNNNNTTTSPTRVWMTVKFNSTVIQDWVKIDNSAVGDFDTIVISDSTGWHLVKLAFIYQGDSMTEAYYVCSQYDSVKIFTTDKKAFAAMSADTMFKRKIHIYSTNDSSFGYFAFKIADSTYKTVNTNYSMLNNGTFGLSVLKNYVDILPAIAPVSWNDVHDIDDIYPLVDDLEARLTAARAAKLDSITALGWTPTFAAAYAGLVADSILKDPFAGDTTALWMRYIAHACRDSVAKDSVAFQGSAAGLTASEVADSIFKRKIHIYATWDSTFGYYAHVTLDSLLRLTKDSIWFYVDKFVDSLDRKLTDIPSGGSGLSAAEHDSLYATLIRMRSIQAVLGMSNAKVIYVDNNGNNTNGTNWVNAYQDFGTAAGAMTGYTEYFVFVAPGTYASQRIVVPSNNVHIIGAGAGLVNVSGSADSTGIFIATSTTGFELAGMTIDAGSNTNYIAKFGSGANIHECVFKGTPTASGGDDFFLKPASGAINISIHDNVFSGDNVIKAIETTTNRNIRIYNNQFMGGYQQAIRLVATDASLIYGNAFRGRGTALSVDASSDSNLVFSNAIAGDSTVLLTDGGGINKYVNNLSVSEFSQLNTLQKDLKHISDSTSVTLSAATVKLIADSSAYYTWKDTIGNWGTGKFGTQIDAKISSAGTSAALTDSLDVALQNQKHIMALLASYNAKFVYVDSASGNNANSGASWSAPKATLTNAVASLSGGVNYIIFVGLGTYDNEYVRVNTANVKILGYGRGRTIVKGMTDSAYVFNITASRAHIANMSVVGDSVNSAVLRVASSGNVIQNCDFSGYCANGATKGVYADVDTGTTDNEFDNNKFLIEGTIGIKIDRRARKVVLDKNTLYGNLTVAAIECDSAKNLTMIDNIIVNKGAVAIRFKPGADSSIFVLNSLSSSGSRLIDSSSSSYNNAIIENFEPNWAFNNNSPSLFSDQAMLDAQFDSLKYYLPRLEFRSDSLKDTTDYYLPKIKADSDSLKDTISIFAYKEIAKTDSINDTLKSFKHASLANEDSIKDTLSYLKPTYDLAVKIFDTVSYYLIRIKRDTDSLKDTTGLLNPTYALVGTLRDTVDYYLIRIKRDTDSLKDTTSQYLKPIFDLATATKDSVNFYLYHIRLDGDSIVYLDNTYLVPTFTSVAQIKDTVNYYLIRIKRDTDSLKDTTSQYLAMTFNNTTQLKDTVNFYLYTTYKKAKDIKDSADYFLRRILAATDSIQDTLSFLSFKIISKIDSLGDTVSFYGVNNYGTGDTVLVSFGTISYQVWNRDTVGVYSTPKFGFLAVQAATGGFNAIDRDTLKYAKRKIDELIAKSDSTRDSVSLLDHKILVKLDSLGDTLSLFAYQSLANEDSLKDTLRYYGYKVLISEDSIKDTVSDRSHKILAGLDSIKDSTSNYAYKILSNQDSLKDSLSYVRDRMYTRFDTVRVNHKMMKDSIWNADSSHFAAGTMGRFVIDGGLGSSGFTQADRDSLIKTLQKVLVIKDSALFKGDSTRLTTLDKMILSQMIADSILNNPNAGDTLGVWLKWLAGVCRDSLRKDSILYRGAAAGLSASEVADSVWRRKHFEYAGLPNTFGAFIDTTISILIGALQHVVAVDIMVYDSVNHVGLVGAKVQVSSISNPNIFDGAETKSDGFASFLLPQNDTLYMRGYANYFMFSNPESLKIATAYMKDTLFCYSYKPPTPPSSGLCNIYSFIQNGSGVGEQGAIITATINAAIPVKYGGILVNRWMLVDTTDVNGLWTIPAFKSALLTPNSTQTTFVAKDSLGHIIGTVSTRVPDSTTFYLKW